FFRTSSLIGPQYSICLRSELFPSNRGRPMINSHRIADVDKCRLSHRMDQSNPLYAQSASMVECPFRSSYSCSHSLLPGEPFRTSIRVKMLHRPQQLCGPLFGVFSRILFNCVPQCSVT
ncbi:hypothetical protein PENTCL1PPCAC_4440, partial [Pristionchus entomophagus]